MCVCVCFFFFIGKSCFCFLCLTCLRSPPPYCNLHELNEQKQGSNKEQRGRQRREALAKKGKCEDLETEN